MNCRECVEYLYPFLDRELTPEVEQEIKQHLEGCPPCDDQYDFEELFLKFVRARCQSQGAPQALRQRILRELFDE
jgi:mycothiol system anti-sigma-R factor